MKITRFNHLVQGRDTAWQHNENSELVLKAESTTDEFNLSIVVSVKFLVIARKKNVLIERLLVCFGFHQILIDYCCCKGMVEVIVNDDDWFTPQKHYSFSSLLPNVIPFTYVRLYPSQFQLQIIHGLFTENSDRFTRQALIHVQLRRSLPSFPWLHLL